MTLHYTWLVPISRSHVAVMPANDRARDSHALRPRRADRAILYARTVNNLTEPYYLFTYFYFEN